MTRGLAWHWLGRVSHARAVSRQEACREQVLAGQLSEQAVFLAELEPTITLGRSADPRNLLVTPDELSRRGVVLCRASRGGEATYHGPGQLLVYPVVRLRGGLVAYLETLAGSLATVAARLGVTGAKWKRAPAGLWLGDAKLAACGVHLRRRVSIHGFSLDVATPHEAWEMINPCGLVGVRTTSIAAECAAHGVSPPPAVADVAAIAGPIVCRDLDRLLGRALPSMGSAAEPTPS